MIELNKIYNDDCINKLKQLPDNFIDSIVTDPPYEINMMLKKWDNTGIAFNKVLWQECLRVLKPGGHLLAFGATRTFHRMTCVIEDVGFEIRDSIVWLSGQGMPKSMNVSKAIDKHFGATREVIGSKIDISTGKPMTSKQAKAGNGKNIHEGYDRPWRSDEEHCEQMTLLTAPATPEAKQWDGWGTALKPTHENITVARKPLCEKTVAKNVLKWGTGALNIDATRILSDDSPKHCVGKGYASITKAGLEQGYRQKDYYEEQSGYDYTPSPLGRYPSNVILDEVSADLLEEQTGHTNTSRFFYVSKTTRKERGVNNNHPTTKPLKLMEYLVKLVTPPNGIVLDPFMGSGTTAIACDNLNFSWIGIEISGAYCNISNERIEANLKENLRESEV